MTIIKHTCCGSICMKFILGFLSSFAFVRQVRITNKQNYAYKQYISGDIFQK